MNPIATKLLQWYSTHKRTLPWRLTDSQHSPIDTAYAVWLSEIMLQQTTVKAVIPYFKKFTTRWPTLTHMANAPLDDVLAMWAGLGYYARARNLHKCACIVTNAYDGKFPVHEKDLLALPGIGAYTAAAISAFAYGQRCVVVDTNVERVISRIYHIKTPLPKAKPIIYKYMDIITPHTHAGDFAQAVMDLASAVCTPKSPQCLICPLQSECKPPIEQREFLPYKAPKKIKPHRYGYVYVVYVGNTNTVLTHTRPSKGLLGGMQGLPTTDWADTYPQSHAQAPIHANWQDSGTYKHTFTHFHLHIKVFVTHCKTIPKGFNTSNGDNVPTVFTKALKCIQSKS